MTTRAQIIEDVRECLERVDERDEEVIDILLTLGYIDGVAPLRGNAHAGD